MQKLETSTHNVSRAIGETSVNTPLRTRTTKSPTLRAIKIQRQREQLLETGLALFFEQGFEGTSVTDITDSVGISQRTFFRYFNTKEELAFDWVNANGKFAIDVLKAQPFTQSTMESMKEMHRLLADRIDADLQKNARLTRMIFDSPTLSARAHYEFAKWEQAFLQLLTHGRRTKLADKRKIEVVVAVNITAFVVAVRQWSHHRSTTSVRPWVLAALDAL